VHFAEQSARVRAVLEWGGLRGERASLFERNLRPMRHERRLRRNGDAGLLSEHAHVSRLVRHRRCSLYRRIHADVLRYDIGRMRWMSNVVRL